MSPKIEWRDIRCGYADLSKNRRIGVTAMKGGPERPARVGLVIGPKQDGDTPQRSWVYFGVKGGISTSMPIDAAKEFVESLKFAIDTAEKATWEQYPEQVVGKRE